MCPTLLIGPVAVPTYPLLLLLALWAGLWLSARRAEQLGLNGDHIYNAGLYGFLAGILGARLWFVLAHWENYAPDLTQAFSLSRSALSAGEGIIMAGIVGLIYLQRNRVPLGLFLDAAAPGLALALVIGPVGAFLGGVALGAPANWPWAVEIAGIARHPVQLYEALAGLMILIILYLARNWRPWPGFQFWSFVVLYGLARLLLEIFRARPYLIGDHYRAAQIMALAAIVVALAVMAYNFTQDTKEIPEKQ
ncbi:MAG: prolipoprotein diacylglyceryl transferase [Anaerolineae bacterium]|nr:prolipoprotein diacylglyceryl transferase [Anaerolineae bacterium]